MSELHRTALLALSGLAGLSLGAGVLVLGYAHYSGTAPRTAERAPVRAVAPPVPTQPAPSSAAAMRPLPMPQGRTSAQRGADGHFHFDTAVNGVGARMLFDTGASYVTLRYEDAARLGININTLEFTGRSRTANGITEVAPVMLDTLRVGDILRRNVQALVLRPGKLSVNLLGQSFMSKLKGYRFEGGELVLQDN